jgi:uncharacterized membrane protein
MNKFVVAIFSDEAVAISGARKLKDFGNKDRTLFDTLAVVARSADGTFSVKDSVQEASATPAAALIGAVAGFAAGGPAAAALAATAGALVGLSADLLNRGADADFIERVARELSPGKAAIVAEVPEDRTDDFHARMEAVGGTIVRCRGSGRSGQSA